MDLNAPKTENEKYADVELAPHPNAGSHFFLEHTSMWSLLITVAMLTAFVCMHGAAALRSPAILANKEEYYKLNATEGNVSIDIEITLSQLQEGHRFISVNGSFVDNGSRTGILPVELSVRKTLQKNYNTVQAGTDEGKKKFDLAFRSGSNRSSWFDVVHVPLHGVDTVQLRLTLTANFDNVAGFWFRWDFANPNAEKYDQSSKLLMSFLVGYMLVVFAFYLKFDAEIFTQVFLLIIGVTGVFASNPLNYFIKPAPGAHIADHILMSVFIAIFRLFLVLQCELIRSHSQTPPKLLIIILSVFFGFYATIDAASSYDRHSHVFQAETPVRVVFQTEIANIVFTLIFVVGLIGYFIVGVIGNEGANIRRIIFLGVSILAVVGTTLVSQVYFVITGQCMYSLLPSMLTSAAHITFASIALFLLHSGGGREYKTIPDQAKEEQPPMMIEEMSDGDGESDDSDEEEDEDDS